MYEIFKLIYTTKVKYKTMKKIIYSILLKIFLLKKKYDLRKIDYNEIPNLSFKNNLNQKASHSENYIKKIFPDFIIDNNELEEIIKINERLIEEKKYFDNFWYQCGGLEEEIYLVYFLLKYLNPQNILEIGVANGFSSAFTVHYAKKKI